MAHILFDHGRLSTKPHEPPVTLDSTDDDGEDVALPVQCADVAFRARNACRTRAPEIS